MPTSLDPKKILDEALQLEPTTRAFIAETLLDSLDIDHDYPVSPEWLEEIRRRCDEIDSGKTMLLDGDSRHERVAREIHLMKLQGQTIRTCTALPG